MYIHGVCQPLQSLGPVLLKIVKARKYTPHFKQRCWMCRYARVFVFCYTLALHLLIMGVLARWSHGHSQTLAATELLQAKQVCTCSSFADVCGAKQCLHCCVVAVGGVESSCSYEVCTAAPYTAVDAPFKFCQQHSFCKGSDQIYELNINQSAACGKCR